MRRHPVASHGPARLFHYHATPIISFLFPTCTLPPTFDHCPLSCRSTTLTRDFAALGSVSEIPPSIPLSSCRTRSLRGTHFDLDDFSAFSLCATPLRLQQHDCSPTTLSLIPRRRCCSIVDTHLTLHRRSIEPPTSAGLHDLHPHHRLFGPIQFGLHSASRRPSLVYSIVNTLQLPIRHRSFKQKVCLTYGWQRRTRRGQAASNRGTQ